MSFYCKMSELLLGLTFEYNLSFYCCATRRAKRQGNIQKENGQPNKASQNLVARDGNITALHPGICYWERSFLPEEK